MEWTTVALIAIAVIGGLYLIGFILWVWFIRKMFKDF